jgi:uncharacterized protein
VVKNVKSEMNLSVENCTEQTVICRGRKLSANSLGAYSLMAALLMFSFYFAEAQKVVPELWGLHVHDEAHLLTQPTIDKLEQQLRAYQDSTSNEIAILITPSLDGDVLENYSMRVVEHWKLGKSNKDNGVLLLIVADEHKIRIEVGYGLEGVLTDAQTSRIIRNELAPYFRKNEYDKGVTAAIDAILRTIGGEYTDDEESGIEALGTTGRVLLGLFIFGILGAFTFMGLFIPGFGGWILYAFLIPFYAAFPMIVLGTIGGMSILAFYVIAFPILKLILGKTNLGKKMAKTMATANRGSGRGWSGGSGWSSGGSRSSGGFSGGGGSFGGGGSSGSW